MGFIMGGGGRNRVARSSVRAEGLVAVLIAAGFALFLVFNTLTLWGGFPIGSIFALAIPDVLRSWSVVQAASMTLTFLLGTLAARRAPGPRLVRVSVVIAILLGLAGCGLLASPSRLPELTLIVTAGLFGISNGLFYLLWEQAMAALPESTTFKIVLVATAFFPLTYFCMRMISAVSLVMGVAVLVLSGALLMVALLDAERVRSLGVSASDRSTSEEEAAAARRSPSPSSSAGVPDYRGAIHIMRGSLVCVGAIGFMVAITRSLALSLISDYELVGVYALIGVIVSAALLLIIWFVFRRPFDLPTFYKMVFPLAITILLVMSFAPAAWANLISAFFYLLFTVVSSLIMLSGIQVGRATDTSPVFCFGILAFACYLMEGIGTVLSAYRLTAGDMNQTTVLLVVLLCVYLLSMAAISISNKRFDNDIAGGPSAFSGRPERSVHAPETAEDRDRGDDVGQVAAAVGDDAGLLLLERRCALIAGTYQLSSRESEIMACIIRGHDVRRIAKELYISENTVRYHSKNLYRKLGVHNKQEVLAIYEEL